MALLTAEHLVAQLRETCPGISIKVKCRAIKGGWIASCKAGFDDGAHPVWQQQSTDREAAIQTVVHNALLEMYEMNRKTVLFITHDLEEAIYLADRVLVMTTRPGSIKQTIFVDLPRPRPTELLGKEEFLQLKEEAIAAVHEEAVKAFEAGEREMA